MVPTTKWCTDPGHTGPNPLPLNRFGRHRSSWDGLRQHCRECTAAETRRWAAANHDRYIEQKRDRYQANRARNRAEALGRWAKGQAETLEQATRRGQPWTGPEMDIAARADLTAREAALMIGRTAGSVQQMRNRLRRDDDA